MEAEAFLKMKKFILRVIANDVEMLAPLTISKKEFDRQLKFLRQQVKDVEDDDDCEVFIQEDIFNFDYNHATLTSYCFGVRATSVFLNVWEAKEGNHYKNKM